MSASTVAVVMSAAHIAYQVIRWFKAHQTQLAAIEKAAEEMGPDVFALFSQIKAKAAGK